MNKWASTSHRPNGLWVDIPKVRYSEGSLANPNPTNPINPKVENHRNIEPSEYRAVTVEIYPSLRRKSGFCLAVTSTFDL